MLDLLIEVIAPFGHLLYKVMFVLVNLAYIGGGAYALYRLVRTCHPVFTVGLAILLVAGLFMLSLLTKAICCVVLIALGLVILTTLVYGMVRMFTPRDERRHRA